MSEDELEQRFRDIWVYCMFDHRVGGLVSGPCPDCIEKYAVAGPPDGRWNRSL